MYTIYHNNRCKKSREGLAILQESGKEFRIREYLKEPLSIAELTKLLEKLNIEPIELVRKGEKIWKEELKHTNLNKDEIIKAMVNNPKLIERPIVENGKSAIIGRPPSDIEKLL